MERIGREIDGELRRFGPQGAMADLVAAWPGAVGPEIARFAWPARVGRDGTLHAHAADSVWAFELGQRAPEIAERLGVPAIRFAPGPLPEPAPERAAGDAAAVVAPGPAEEALAARLVAGIDDEELRALVRRAAAASLARAADDRPV